MRQVAVGDSQMVLAKDAPLFESPGCNIFWQPFVYFVWLCRSRKGLLVFATTKGGELSGIQAIVSADIENHQHEC